MIRRPPRSTLSSSSAASDVYKRQRLISPYIFTDKYLILEYPHSFFGGSVPALFVLNGMPIYNDGWSTVKTISPGTITSLTILKGKQGYFRYGSAAQGGVVFINTMSEDPK